MKRAGLILLAGCALAAAAGTMVWRGSAPPAPRPRPAAAATLTGRPRAADPAAGAALFARCAACHSIGRSGVDLDGPNLYGVVGAPVAGRRPRYNYTSALRGFGGTWSFDRLDTWLADPRALVPGTAMVFPGLPDPQDRADLIAYLARQGGRLALP